MKSLPKARTADIIEMDADGELLIYDLRINKAYTLNETSKIVYRHCNGRTTFDELEKKYKFTADLIHLALGELNTSDLLENYASDHFDGLSRREVIRRAGLASMVALPVISSLIAPSAAGAASVSCTPGNDNSDPNNGVYGQGSTCICGASAQSNAGIPLCNSTRGEGGVGGDGCKQGCLCRADTERCNTNGVCVGVCG